METTESQRQELMALEKMFESEGWRIFKRDQQALLDHFRSFGWDQVKDMNGLWFAKGMMTSLHAMINHDKPIDAQKQAWAEHVQEKEPEPGYFHS
jgi:hypothetical protein